MRTGKRYIKVKDRRKDLFKITQAAKILNTTPRTIRYYEQIGLLPPVKRTQGKMRLYTQTDIDLIREIKKHQEKGSSLDAIKTELEKFQKVLMTEREANKIKVLVDSTASIPFDLARQNGIEIIPMHIKLGKDDLLDGLDVSSEQLKARVEAGRLAPESAPPTEEEFIAAYTSLYEAGAEKIISIHLSAQISDAVKIAKKAASYIKDFEVQVIDAGTMAGGAALLAFAVAADISNEKDIKDILFDIEELKKKQSEAVVLNSVEKLLGREKENTLLKALTDFKPVLTIKDSKLTLLNRAKSLDEAEDNLLSFCQEKGALAHIIVMHSNMPEAAEHLLMRLEKAYKEVKCIIFPFSSVVTANLGHELLGVAVC